MKTLFLSLFLAFSITAQARDKVGNGGAGYACRDATGALQAVYLVDLFEGSLPLYPNLNGYTYSKNATDIQKELERAITRASVHPAFAVELSKTLTIIKNSIVMLPKPSRLKAIEDVYSEVQMDGCDLVQIANYFIENESGHHRVDIDGEYYSKMDVLNQAALLVHEAVYALIRQNTLDTDSKRARHITAMLMAEDEISDEILSATGEIFDYITDENLKKLQNCKPDSNIQVIGRLHDGPSPKESLFVKLNANQENLDKDFTLITSGSTARNEMEISCENLRKITWQANAGNKSDYLHYSILVKLDGKLVFSKTSSIYFFEIGSIRLK